MSDKSSIEWTDASWNPIRGISPSRHACQKISPGCDNWDEYPRSLVPA